MHKIILFELNEVPLRILDYFQRKQPNSWLATTMPRLKKFETVSENPGHLSPWNTWPTLHRGVPSDQHFIADFNQDLSKVDKEFPPIWKLLSDNNVGVGVFGSLHSYPMPDNFGQYQFYVPDVFAAGKECFPKHVELFQDINLKLSRESARNVDSAIPYSHIFQLLLNFNRLGFKLDTATDIAQHLVQERLDTWKVVRRRTYQSVISFDVFYKLLRTKKPDFVTFFTNHVASSMHRYWAALFPDEYEEQPYDDQWISRYGNEILFSMGKADDMLRKLASFVDRNPEYKLIITSSMGQNAVEFTAVETQLYVEDHARFMAMLGIADPAGFTSKPAMVPQFNYAIADHLAADFEQTLSTFAVNGKSVKYRKHTGNTYSIDLGQSNLKEVAVSVNGQSIPLADSGLKNVEIQDKSSATAYHIAEGHLFSYHPSHQANGVSSNQLPTCEIAPMLMHNFGLKPKDYMPKADFSRLETAI